MAEIPKLADPKKGKSSTETSSERDLLIGFTSEVPLIVKELNKNPLQISGLFKGTTFSEVPPSSPLYANSAGWNAFQSFLLAKGVVGKKEFNAKKEALTKQWIEEFNSGESVINGKVFDHVKKFPQNVITIKQVILAQQYHKKVDPNIQVDEGWVGSQTSQLRYPDMYSYYVWDINEEKRTGSKNLPLITTGAYIPIIWGNKRFIVKVEEQVENYYKSKGKSSLPLNRENWLLYSEDKFPNIKLASETPAGSITPALWYTIDQQTEPNKSSLEVNSKTEQQNKIKENFKSQTKITSNILAKK